jgi:RNA polymerase sigma-70 factor (sigma-E family)
VDDLLAGSDTAGHASAAVGFLSAPISDAVGDRGDDTVDDESSADGCPDGEPRDAAASAGSAAAPTAPAGAAAVNGSVVNGTAVEGSAVVSGAIAVNGASGINGAVHRTATAPADAVPVLPVLDDVAVAAGVEVGDGAEAAVEPESDVTDGDVDDEAIAAPETDGGNLSAAGEPSDAGTRRTDVTETLAANALLPEVVLAPDAFTAQARAAWDAADVVTEIYTGHYNQLVRLAVLLVHDVQTAEEVVQDAFEAMHLAWRRLRDSEKALSYLRQTVVNRSRSVLRHRKVVDMHAPKPAPDEPSAEHAALTLLERSAVAAALRSLPLRQREAIVLRYYADFSEADIAAAMGISRGAVKSHTARAMAALKSILEQETS